MNLNTIYQGNALVVLKTFPDASIDMVATSPPYWSLRDYNTEPLVWDADIVCDHQWDNEIVKKLRTKPGINALVGTTVNEYQGNKINQGCFCSLCGTWRGSLGLEPSPDLFIKHLCDIFCEVRRVLKKAGSCYVNIGDSYGGTHAKTNEQKGKGRTASLGNGQTPKSLVGIPYRFALEMINRGWILRNEIIWHKNNAMPSSTRDRFTVDFESMFFFTKSGKYYFEQQFEPQGKVKEHSTKHRDWQRGMNERGSDAVIKVNPLGRNKRCVWTISTSGFKEAHFAVFPENLVKIPIMASCPLGGIVLDPFCGVGTTLLAAERVCRNWIGIDLNPEYIKLANVRIEAVRDW